MTDQYRDPDADESTTAPDTDLDDETSVLDEPDEDVTDDAPPAEPIPDAVP